VRLQAVVPGSIWHVQQPVKIGPLHVATRSTFVKLKDESVWVHSPVAPSVQLLAELAEIGPVRHVVAPNRSHHLFFAQFIAAYPGAKGYLAPDLIEKRPDLVGHEKLHETNAQAWSPELAGYFVDGIPTLNETVWFHQETGALLLTDLLFCFGNHNQALLRFLAGLLGVRERLGMSRTMKMLVKDKAALAAVARKLLALDVRRVVLAHDQIVEDDAQAWLEAAFAWLLKNGR